MSLSNKNTEVKTDLKLIPKENKMERRSLDINSGSTLTSTSNNNVTCGHIVKGFYTLCT